MKVAMPVSSGRISTAFDFARRLLVVEYEDGREIGRWETDLEEQIPLSRAHRIENLGIDRLICGAISRHLAKHFEDAGIEVLPLVSGSVEEVLAAHLSGELEQTRFLMPGCTPEQRRALQELRNKTGVPSERNQR